eukprot:5663434-Pyramimonas_sp.AAC.1
MVRSLQHHKAQHGVPLQRLEHHRVVHERVRVLRVEAGHEHPHVADRVRRVGPLDPHSDAIVPSGAQLHVYLSQAGLWAPDRLYVVHVEVQHAVPLVKHRVLAADVVLVQVPQRERRRQLIRRQRGGVPRAGVDAQRHLRVPRVRVEVLRDPRGGHLEHVYEEPRVQPHVDPHGHVRTLAVVHLRHHLRAVGARVPSVAHTRALVAHAPRAAAWAAGRVARGRGRGEGQRGAPPTRVLLHGCQLGGARVVRAKHQGVVPALLSAAFTQHLHAIKRNQHQRDANTRGTVSRNQFPRNCKYSKNATNNGTAASYARVPVDGLLFVFLYPSAIGAHYEYILSPLPQLVPGTGISSHHRLGEML